MRTQLFRVAFHARSTQQKIACIRCVLSHYIHDINFQLESNGKVQSTDSRITFAQTYENLHVM